MTIYNNYCDFEPLSDLLYNRLDSIDYLSSHSAIDSFYNQTNYPIEIIAVTDFGCDHDDELAFVITRALEKKGIIKLKGVIVNHSSSDERPKLVKSALNDLGFDPNLPVARGSDDAPNYKPKAYEFEAKYMDNNAHIQPNGQFTIKELCEQATFENKKINLVLLSGMTDARDFIKNNSELAKKSIGHISIMGGIKVTDGKAVLNNLGHVQPSGVYNNAVGTLTSETSISLEAIELYELIQKLEIPLTIVTREAAYDAHITPKFYDDLATVESNVTARLQAGQKKSIEQILWNFFLRERGIEMFCDKFTDGKLETLEKLKLLPENPPFPEGKSPYQFVTKLIPYDPLTVLSASLPDSETFYIPEIMNDKVKIIGLDNHNTGIADSRKLISLLHELAMFGASKSTV